MHNDEDDEDDDDDMVDPEDVQLKEELDFEDGDEGGVEDISKDMLQQQVMAVAPAGDDDDEDLLEQ